jgi:hypothetical protein
LGAAARGGAAECVMAPLWRQAIAARCSRLPVAGATPPQGSQRADQCD